MDPQLIAISAAVFTVFATVIAWGMGRRKH